jgi:hypothetical protein
MKTIDIDENSEQVMALLEQARKEDLVLQLVDGSQFVLSAAKKANEYEMDLSFETALSTASANFRESIAHYFG